MAKKPKPPSPITGRWRIVSMSAWEDDYLDEEVEAFIEFEEKCGGSFQFGYVRGLIDWRPTHGTASRPWNGPGREATAPTARR
jgi:hypothetical protein